MNTQNFMQLLLLLLDVYLVISTINKSQLVNRQVLCMHISNLNTWDCDDKLNEKRLSYIFGSYDTNAINGNLITNVNKEV